MSEQPAHLDAPNARFQPPLEAVGCKPLFGSAGLDTRTDTFPHSRTYRCRQSNPGGGYSANCGKSSVISNHGAFAPQKM